MKNIQNKKFYKVLNVNRNHNGFQYVDGLNILKDEFMTTGSCCKGGLYFTTEKYINQFLGFGCYLVEVFLPSDHPEFKIVKDPSGAKWRANMIILGNKVYIGNISTNHLILLNLFSLLPDVQPGKLITSMLNNQNNYTGNHNTTILAKLFDNDFKLPKDGEGWKTIIEFVLENELHEIMTLIINHGVNVEEFIKQILCETYSATHIIIRPYSNVKILKSLLQNKDLKFILENLDWFSIIKNVTLCIEESEEIKLITLFADNGININKIMERIKKKRNYKKQQRQKHKIRDQSWLKSQQKTCAFQIIEPVF